MGSLTDGGFVRLVRGVVGYCMNSIVEHPIIPIVIVLLRSTGRHIPTSHQSFHQHANSNI